MVPWSTHEHLLGSSGEGSLALQSPEIFLREIIRAGITTVVGTLGVDTTMKTIAGLLGRVKALKGEGITAAMWTGGYVFYEQQCGLVVKHGFSLDLVLPLVTTNPARILKLPRKGRVAVGCDADVLVLDKGLTVREVVARGQRMVIDGTPAKGEKFLEGSKRNVELVGYKLGE